MKIYKSTMGSGLALCALALITPACIYFIRVSRGFFDVGAGEYLPLGSMLWLYPLLTLPISFIVGFAFPLAAVLVGGHPRVPPLQEPQKPKRGDT